MGQKWTSEELQLLKSLWPDHSCHDVMKVIKRSYSGICGKASHLGLKKSESYNEKLNEMFADTLRKEGVKSRFKKGHTPKNKGLKWDEYLKEEHIEKLKKTQFKKGLRPHNWKPVGSERVNVEGYVEVKVQDKKGNRNYDLKQRIIWREHYGEIPAGQMVVFIDGNKQNFELSNLKLISMTENMNRNCYSDQSIVKRLMKVKDEDLAEHIINCRPDLVEMKKQSMNLKKQLKQHDTR
jgi:hypothetical protein